jgi:hypothetical protein
VTFTYLCVIRFPAGFTETIMNIAVLEFLPNVKRVLLYLYNNQRWLVRYLVIICFKGIMVIIL